MQLEDATALSDFRFFFTKARPFWTINGGCKNTTTGTCAIGFRVHPSLEQPKSANLLDLSHRKHWYPMVGEAGDKLYAQGLPGTLYKHRGALVAGPRWTASRFIQFRQRFLSLLHPANTEKRQKNIIRHTVVTPGHRRAPATAGAFTA